MDSCHAYHYPGLKTAELSCTELEKVLASW